MTPRGPAGGEFAIIDRLRRRLPGPPAGEVWIGDDAAVVDPGPGRLLVTTDMSVAGVHADLALVGLDDLGWRSVASAVSDIAAMGGRATDVLVAAAGPPSTDMDALLGGVIEAAAAHGCAIVGGDLSLAAEVVVAVTVTGTVSEGPGPVLRSGASAGDHLFVTGPVGAAAAGLRALRARAATGPGRQGPPPDAAVVEAYRRPRARLAEGELARRAGATAMIDISDGLAADLGHLAESSAVGVRLEHVPVARGATVDEALGGGDDFELVFAAPDPEAMTAAFAEAGLSVPLLLGLCTADRSERQWDGTALPTTGWEHRWM